MVIEDVPDSGPARAGNVIVRPEAVGICGSEVVHALARGGLRAGEQVVVFGAGPIGLATVRLVSAHSASLTALFSHHFPLERAAEAFEFAMRRPQDAIKIAVTVN
jgi:threonine dehydrogenase-like Zn-dependent dehydrogenase